MFLHANVDKVSLCEFLQRDGFHLRWPSLLEKGLFNFPLIIRVNLWSVKYAILCTCRLWNHGNFIKATWNPGWEPCIQRDKEKTVFIFWMGFYPVWVYATKGYWSLISKTDGENGLRISIDKCKSCPTQMLKMQSD